MQKYSHKEIESKWQKYWEENGTFTTKIDYSKPKYYVLDMFPFPSGSGLHVGHAEGYTATDIVARFRRMKGYNVLHPMGWDSFGLPAEQYAVRTGTHPSITTKQNIDNFRRQLKALGISYDWSRELATSDSTYYKWTQWIFAKLCERGLAYEAEVSVNFCPFLGTVLANEEVENGRSKEGGHPVVRKPLKQWMLRITAYAERLLKDLDLVDWPHSVKQSQINWIGKSEGALIDFSVEGTEENITVFTTCPHTLFGVTYVALAPEHPLVEKLTDPSHKAQVIEYQEKVRSKSDLERTELNKEKSGVFIGSYAVNPASGKKVPIWIADYVLPTYGTGSVMAVPAHDGRDFEFAIKHNLKVLPILVPTKEVYELDPQDGLSYETFCDELKSGKRVWEGSGVQYDSENAEISLNGMDIADKNNDPKESIILWLEKKGLGQRRIHYKLRDWLFSRQRYWGEPIPVYHYEDGTYRVMDLDELPLILPEVHDFKPSSDGQSPLAKIDEWIHTVDPKTDKKARRETNTMPNWAGSCWYYLRFCDPANEGEAWAKEAEKYWLPVDLYVGGVEHAVLHLLYSRFWHKVLYDCGLVSTLEPFQMLRNQGLIVARSYKNSHNLYVAPEDVIEKEGKYFHKTSEEELHSQVEKMSKSKLNGITPDEIIDAYGADALRLYEMFMGPLEKEKVWNTDAVAACRRFLSRIFDIVASGKLCDEDTEESLKLTHRLVAKVDQDLMQLQFNTSIAKMMEFVNEFTKWDHYPKNALIALVQVLSPFAPHIAEELWQMLGRKDSLTYAPFPTYDAKYLQDDSVTYVIQVNGKVRGKIDFPRDQNEETITKLANDHPNVARFCDGKEIQKIIFVPNKLLNIVLKN